MKVKAVPPAETVALIPPIAVVVLELALAKFIVFPDVNPVPLIVICVPTGPEVG